MLVVLAASVLLASGSQLRSNLLATLPSCSQDVVLPVTPVVTFGVVIKSLCVIRCVTHSSCHSINICPHTAGLPGYMCQLLPASSNQSCSSLRSQQGCQFLLKYPRCQNGGTYIPPYCQCLEEFTGPTCDRHYRDCTEAFEGGVTKQMSFLNIQPSGLPAPVLVTCYMTSTGWTKIQRRLSGCPGSFNRTWEQYKQGWRDTCGFWIGLDAIHALTTQGNYQLLIWTSYTQDMHRNIYYNDFSVSTESSGYVVTYSPGQVATSFPSGDGFGFGGPTKDIKGRPFATWDHPDAAGCAVRDGGGWWYGSDCPDTNLNKNMSTSSVAQWLDNAGRLEDLIYESMSVRRI